MSRGVLRDVNRPGVTIIWMEKRTRRAAMETWKKALLGVAKEFWV